MKLTVDICGESLFIWEGDNTAIDRLSTELEALAEGTGHSGMTIADNVVQWVGKAGLPAEETAGRGAMAWITYRLLHTDTHHPEHLGKYVDYAPVWDFEFNLVPHADDRGRTNRGSGGSLRSVPREIYDPITAKHLAGGKQIGKITRRKAAILPMSSRRVTLSSKLSLISKESS